MRISAAGGHDPFWRKDGRELFYYANPGQMAVAVKLGDAPEIGVPHLLFQPGAPTVSADGQHFLTIESAGELPAARISVVLNWTAELAGK
jgi:hypothetical protein